MTSSFFITWVAIRLILTSVIRVDLFSFLFSNSLAFICSNYDRFDRRPPMNHHYQSEKKIQPRIMYTFWIFLIAYIHLHQEWSSLLSSLSYTHISMPSWNIHQTHPSSHSHAHFQFTTTNIILIITKFFFYENANTVFENKLKLQFIKVSRPVRLAPNQSIT